MTSLKGVLVAKYSDETRAFHIDAPIQSGGSDDLALAESPHASHLKMPFLFF